MIQTELTQLSEYFPNEVKKVDKTQNIFSFSTENNVHLIVHILDDQIIRFRYATDGHFPNDFSYAISEDFNGSIQYTEYSEQKEFYEIRTALLKCRVSKHNMCVTILNLDDEIINSDEKGFHWEELQDHGGNIVQMTKFVHEGEHFFGLGDKPTNLNIRGKRFKMWGTDEYGYDRDTDPLYKSIPFYMGIHHNLGYGIFFDNTFSSHFDFASERRNATSFWAMGGEMNYYFIYGPQLMDVVRKYSLLTGLPELPPKWALGYHQCKWSYYPEGKVKEVTNKFRELELPCDAIYLDIDYMDGFRCFTWDEDRFPNPKGLVNDLKAKGFKTVVIIDPGIKIDEDYWVYKEAMEKGYFCKRADGPLMKGKVWPGECYFPDFTNPEVREWWAGLYKGLVGEVGVHGVWNDMNEPAVFEVDSKTFPNDVRHFYEGEECSHRKAHNIYGMQMARATYEGVKANGAPDRPFIITRSCYSGSQRYSSVWTGDNKATWDHLTLASIQCQRLAVSGISFAGSDVGGFIDHPTSELYIRWIQLAVFHPFFRTHSSGDHGHQEPWSFGKEALNIVRKYLQLRYKLLPYLYTTFYQYTTEATPMTRPLAYAAQYDVNCIHREDEFMCGDHILTCHMPGPNMPGRHVYIPKGKWFNFWTDDALKGGTEQGFLCPIEDALIFIRAGAVIPMYPYMQYVGERKIEAAQLHVYYKNGQEESSLYEDAGNGYDYENGDYKLSAFSVIGDDHQLKLKQYIKGSYAPEYDEFEIHFHGLPGKPKGSFTETYMSEKSGAKVVYVTRVPAGFDEVGVNF